MERSSVLTMRRAILFLLLLGIAAHGRAGPDTVVLVVPADSKVIDLDSITVRKLFLGLPVLINGSPLHPLRNRSDARFDSIFLQQIAAMSQSAYDRQTLIGVNRQRSMRPVELTTSARVLDALYSDPNAITFMWLRDVEHNPKIRVIRILWSD
jgi:hypothetical protein